MAAKDVKFGSDARARMMEAEKGMLAVACALFAIMIYIWFRFEWQFSIAAFLALTHDVLTTIGLFALTGFEFNLATLAAILTIADIEYCGF